MTRAWPGGQTPWLELRRALGSVFGRGEGRPPAVWASPGPRGPPSAGSGLPGHAKHVRLREERGEHT